MSSTITTSLPKIQYIEFLKFCKKNNLKKSHCVQEAVLKYCNIEGVNTRNNLTVESELNQLLKEEKK